MDLYTIKIEMSTNIDPVNDLWIQFNQHINAL